MDRLSRMRRQTEHGGTASRGCWWYERMSSAGYDKSGLPHTRVVARVAARFAKGSGTAFTSEAHETALANSTRNDTQRRPPRGVDADSQEWSDTVQVQTGLMGESRSNLETPPPWYGSPRSEC